jgi:RNA polymerase sigma factor (sigma-70 family)
MFAHATGFDYVSPPWRVHARPACQTSHIARSVGLARRSHILTLLLTHHRSALLRQAANHSYRRADAEDALQDACERFLGHYDGPAGADALRWMMLVTKRCAWAIGARQRRHEPPAQLSAPDAVADSQLEPALLAERRQEHAECRVALGRLKPDQRAALLLLAAGCSYREVGELRGWTYTKVNRCLNAGRAALRAAAVPA